MRIFRHYTQLPAAYLGGVLVLGNFDGVHRGHRRVIARGAELALSLGLPLGVMTFEPHPRQVFSPQAAPFRLTPMRIKARLIEPLGVDFLIFQHFDHDFAQLSAESFVRDVLADCLRPHHVVVGYDYSFGKDRGGDKDLLIELGQRAGFETHVVAPVLSEGGAVYSSTRIRHALQQGQPREAASMLGHEWEIEARVERGDQRGRQIGFPTANVPLDDYLRPAFGVYAIRAGIDHGLGTVWHDGIANIGRRPTFGKSDEILEAHLFDFSGDLYGKHLRVALIDFIRPERRFDSLQALQKQIVEDSLAAQAILAAHHDNETDS